MKPAFEDMSLQIPAATAEPEMILQSRNHPSIILWGVRINESVDDDAFYIRTNQIAHQLDPSRATSGVRYHRRAAGNAGALFLHAHSVEQQTSQTCRSGLFAISK